VFWAHASNTARLEQSFREIADQAKIRGRKDPQADVFKLVHDWLRDKKNGQWLLVLDNADDATVLSPPSSDGQTSSIDISTDGGSSSSRVLQQHLNTYLPSSTHGSVIVTSRTRRAAMEMVEDSDILIIEPMHNTAAHALLHRKLGDKVDRSKGIDELAAALEYMPLALVQAAAYIRGRAPRCSVQQYLADYRKSDKSKTSLLNREAGHLRRDPTASNSILITWQISFEHIRSSRRSAADLLSLMSFFDRQGIQDYLLCNPDGTTDNNVFEDDIDTLRDYRFITVTKEANTFEMHDLVQLATRRWLEDQGQFQTWQGRFISNLCAELPIELYLNWSKCQTLFPHARVALAQRPQDKESLKMWALLLHRASWYAHQQRRDGDAEHMATLSMEARKEAFGEENVDTLDRMHMIGTAKMVGGKYEEAEVIYRQVIALEETVLGRKHLTTLTSMSLLATLLIHRENYKEAEEMHRQVLALRETMLGRKHLTTLRSMSNLAATLNKLHKHEEAEAMNRQVLELKITALGREHPDTLVSMHHLAEVLAYQRKYEEAEEMIRETLALKQTLLGREHPGMLTDMGILARVLMDQGRYEEAEEIDREVLRLREAVLGRENPDTLMSMQNLTVVLVYQRKYTEAIAMSRHILALKETVLGREHPDTLDSVYSLAVLLEKLRRYPESLAL
jgi:tetratricopeptide (TPR) repeat protein